MVAVGSDADGGVVVAEVLRRESGGAVGENDVVRREAFVDRRGRREDEDTAHAEIEGQNVAVFGGEGVQGLGHGLLEEVEVAYEWE